MIMVVTVMVRITILALHGQVAFYSQTIIKYIFLIWSILSSELFFSPILIPDQSCSKANIENKVSICTTDNSFQQEDRTLLHLLRLMQ